MTNYPSTAESLMSDSEGEDEVSDWRLLDAKVLKRGEKDHAPDGTLAQQSVLQASREAMYSAISKPASTAVKNTVAADWYPDRQLAVVRQARGNFFNSMGWADRDGVYLLPEEVLYLAQRGSLICYFEGAALAVQGVVSHCLPYVGIERMQVYSHLKRLGYVVRRPVHDAPLVNPLDSSLCSPYSLVWAICGRGFSSFAWKPFYTSYSSVFKELRVVNQRGPFDTPLEDGKLDFFVWKPSTSFKKSQPPVPDFRVRVVSADNSLPTLDQIANTMGLAPISASKKNSIVTRMKEGYRSFLYAVVDSSIISFVRAAETNVELSINEPQGSR